VPMGMSNCEKTSPRDETKFAEHGELMR
jgi:hypothetical protein